MTIRNDGTGANANYNQNNITFSNSWYNGLLRFDLSSFGTGEDVRTVSEVSNVKLTISVQTATEAIRGQDVQLSFYLMKSENANWDEETATGTMRNATESWIGGTKFELKDYYYDTAVAQTTIQPQGSTLTVTLDLAPSVVMQWINDPGSNAGLVLKSDNAIALAFYNYTNNADWARPILSFDYVLGPPPVIPESSNAGLLLGVIGVLASVGCRSRR